jgi:arylsulfatase A-like enzyme
VTTDVTEPSRLSVLLITLDTTRADALSSYGYLEGVTPRLDEIARQGVRYAWARTVTPLTLPAHASMLTGLYPPRHGIRDNALSVLPGEAVTLAELARDADYETAAFVSAAVLTRLYGLAQGFEVYDEPAGAGQQAIHYRERSAEQVTAAALDWLDKRDPRRPFLLWVHYFDPHLPYQPAPRFLEQGHGNPYLGEVAQMDHYLGEVVARVDPATTLVMVVADHGEGLGQHGEPTHGVYCYDSTLLVPFLIRYADGHRAGEASPETVSVVDVFPTLAEAMGLTIPDQLDGESLYRRQVPPTRGVYYESFFAFVNHGWSPLAGFVFGGAKYIHSPTPELFNLQRDLGEEENVATSNPELVKKAQEAIAQVLERPALPSAEHGDRKLLEQLRSLGYAAEGTSAELPNPLARTDLLSPVGRTSELEEQMRVINQGHAGDTGAAIRGLRELLERNPRNSEARGYLAFFLMRAERFDEAKDVLQEALRREGPRTSTHLNLGYCFEQLGDLESALLHYRRSLELAPSGRVETLANISRVLRTLGRANEAASYDQDLEQLQRGEADTTGSSSPP